MGNTLPPPAIGARVRLALPVYGEGSGTPSPSSWGGGHTPSIGVSREALVPLVHRCCRTELIDPSVLGLTPGSSPAAPWGITADPGGQPHHPKKRKGGQDAPGESGWKGFPAAKPFLPLFPELWMMVLGWVFLWFF